MAVAMNDLLLRLGIHFHIPGWSDSRFDREVRAEGDEEIKK